MVREGPGSYKLRMNKSELEVEIHTLRDGGLLMQASIHFHGLVNVALLLMLSVLSTFSFSLICF
jgi:hypothetical protein